MYRHPLDPDRHLGPALLINLELLDLGQRRKAFVAN